jgi:hypothetical protein
LYSLLFVSTRFGCVGATCEGAYSDATDVAFFANIAAAATVVVPCCCCCCCCPAVAAGVGAATGFFFVVGAAVAAAVVFFVVFDALGDAPAAESGVAFFVPVAMVATEPFVVEGAFLAAVGFGVGVLETVREVVVVAIVFLLALVVAVDLAVAGRALVAFEVAYRARLGCCLLGARRQRGAAGWERHLGAGSLVRNAIVSVWESKLAAGLVPSLYSTQRSEAQDRTISSSSMTVYNGSQVEKKSRGGQQPVMAHARRDRFRV